MATQIKLRRDSYQNWYDTNPLLSQGEPGYDLTNKRLKIGDGVTLWRALAYFDTQQTDLSAYEGDIVPSADNTYNIGSPDFRWKHGFFADSSLYVGDIKLSSVAGQLVVQQVINPGLISEVPVPGTPGAVTTDRLVNGDLAVTLNSSGTLTTPLLLPVAFTAVLDSEHMHPQPGIGFTDVPWELQVQFQVNPNGSVQTVINQIFPQVTNPGYVSGHAFRFTEADHGIPGYVFDVQLNSIQTYEAGTTANLAVSVPPEYPATVSSLGAVKLTADTKDFVFGTDGSLTLPNNPTVTATGNIEINAGNYLSLNSGNNAQLELGAQQTGGSVVVGGKSTQLAIRGRTVYENQDTTFGLPLDIEHYVSGPGEFSGNGLVSLALTLNRTGITYNWSVATLQLNASTQGYQVGDVFAFDETIHGIPSHTVTVTIDSLIEIDPGIWELTSSILNPTVTLAEASKIEFLDTVGILVGPKTWLLDTAGKIYLPAGGDIVDSNGVSVLGGTTFDQQLNTTDSVTFNEINSTMLWQNNAKTSSPNGVNVPGATPTVVFATPNWFTSIKLVIAVEGRLDGDGTFVDHTQTCEATIAATYNTSAEPIMSVYGIVYTSPTPLATFTVARNGITGQIEVTAVNSQTTNAMNVRVQALQFVSRYD